MQLAVGDQLGIRGGLLKPLRVAAELCEQLEKLRALLGRCAVVIPEDATWKLMQGVVQVGGQALDQLPPRALVIGIQAQRLSKKPLGGAQPRREGVGSVMKDLVEARQPASRTGLSIGDGLCQSWEERAAEEWETDGEGGPVVRDLASKVPRPPLPGGGLLGEQCIEKPYKSGMRDFANATTFCDQVGSPKALGLGLQLHGSSSVQVDGQTTSVRQRRPDGRRPGWEVSSEHACDVLKEVQIHLGQALMNNAGMAPPLRRHALLALAPALLHLAGCGLHAQPSKVTVEERAFSFQVPGDWFPAVFDQGTKTFVPLKDFRPGSIQPGGYLIYASPKGDYLLVEFDPGGHGVEGDMTWAVEPRDDRLALLKEGPFCTRPPGVVDEEESCRVGDGRLTIHLTPYVLRLRGHQYFFSFGNALRETGVELQVFRDILATFRAK